MERTLRISGVLLILGLLVEALSLRWNTALSFLSFMIAGGFFFVVGILVYLYSLVSQPTTSASTKERPW
jgi:hypothetical protein